MTTTHSLSRSFLLSQVSNLWTQCQKEALAPLKITPSEYLLIAGIWHLRQNVRIISQTQLADFVKMDMATTSRHLRNLDASGLVQKEPHPHDLRACTISLTNTGKSKAVKAMRVIEDLDILFFGKTYTHIIPALEELVELFQESK